jgi:hypothetical protein
MIWQALLTSMLCISAQGTPAPATECLTPMEATALQGARKLDDRIKIYDKAFQPCQESVKNAFTTSQFDSLRPQLEIWMKLLESSEKDIEANSIAKKKSKALIRYEIRLRKALTDFKDDKLRAPFEYHDEIDAWIDKAETIRGRFVDILFQR